MDLRLRPQPQNGPQTVEDEYQLYISGDLFEHGLDPLRFWERKRKEFPTIFRMAMDYLPIQASAVPCECVFSSSAETDSTKKRNRISPSLMEVLQMLKLHLKKERLNFTRGWITSQKLLLEDEPNEPVTIDGPVQGLDSILRTIMQEEGDGVVDAIELVELPEPVA
ncbi:hypothetical protein AZE42_13557 [Rhizopogon vesiculosus]|uniref:HAT C-terminal dimerisation domain-containing protein n=1 Tax=Rhizopogon vesiculosus TaxID=180088 RepID=A0A1J8QBA8_9AGAM|nr:hypothetical protein AZE42_13557 [Rhizopogon vesiculosus]